MPTWKREYQVETLEDGRDVWSGIITYTLKGGPVEASLTHCPDTGDWWASVGQTDTNNVPIPDDTATENAIQLIEDNIRSQFQDFGHQSVELVD